MSKLATQIEKLRNARSAAEASIKGIDEKLAELVPLYELEQATSQARQVIDVEGLPVGTSVSYGFGRAEKFRNLVGTVAAFNAETKTYRILHGAGFDAEFHNVPSKAVTTLTGDV